MAVDLADFKSNVVPVDGADWGRWKGCHRDLSHETSCSRLDAERIQSEFSEVTQEVLLIVSFATKRDEIVFARYETIKDEGLTKYERAEECDGDTEIQEI